MLLRAERVLTKFLADPLKAETRARPIKLNLEKAKHFFEGIRMEKKLECSPPTPNTLNVHNPLDSIVHKISLPF